MAEENRTASPRRIVSQGGNLRVEASVETVYHFVSATSQGDIPHLSLRASELRKMRASFVTNGIDKEFVDRMDAAIEDSVSSGAIAPA